MRPETAFALHQTALGEPPENLDPDSVDRAIRLLAAYARTVVGDALLTLHLALEPRPSRSFRRNGG
jgi:hypothetical protein